MDRRKTRTVLKRATIVAAEVAPPIIIIPGKPVKAAPPARAASPPKVTPPVRAASPPKVTPPVRAASPPKVTPPVRTIPRLVPRQIATIKQVKRQTETAPIQETEPVVKPQIRPTLAPVGQRPNSPRKPTINALPRRHETEEETGDKSPKPPPLPVINRETKPTQPTTHVKKSPLPVTDMEEKPQPAARGKRPPPLPVIDRKTGPAKPQSPQPVKPQSPQPVKPQSPQPVKPQSPQPAKPQPGVRGKRPPPLPVINREKKPKSPRHTKTRTMTPPPVERRAVSPPKINPLPSQKKGTFSRETLPVVKRVPPETTTKTELQTQSVEEVCCVCSEPAEKGKLGCGHVICKECVGQIRKADCPFCRAKLQGGHVTGKLLKEIESREKEDKKREENIDRSIAGDIALLELQGVEITNELLQNLYTKYKK